LAQRFNLLKRSTLRPLAWGHSLLVRILRRREQMSTTGFDATMPAQHISDHKRPISLQRVYHAQNIFVNVYFLVWATWNSSRGATDRNLVVVTS
jgi:hypothetical protein